jgi:hypothetical protein
MVEEGREKKDVISMSQALDKQPTYKRGYVSSPSYREEQRCRMVL